MNKYQDTLKRYVPTLETKARLYFVTYRKNHKDSDLVHSGLFIFDLRGMVEVDKENARKRFEDLSDHDLCNWEINDEGLLVEINYDNCGVSPEDFEQAAAFNQLKEIVTAL